MHLALLYKQLRFTFLIGNAFKGIALCGRNA